MDHNWTILYIFEEISDNVNYRAETLKDNSKTSIINLIPSNYICTKFATLQSQGKLISIFATDFSMR